VSGNSQEHFQKMVGTRFEADAKAELKEAQAHPTPISLSVNALIRQRRKLFCCHWSGFVVGFV